MLLDTLLNLQTEKNMTQEQFARDVLKVPRSTWNLTVAGYTPIGNRIIQAVLKNLPQYTAEAMIYQRDREAASSANASAAHVASPINDSGRTRTPATTARTS